MLKRTDVKVLTCEFCGKDDIPHTTAMNKHIIGCPSNDSGCSAGLFCHICGKMFAQQKYLKDHLARHGKDQVSFKFMFEKAWEEVLLVMIYRVLKPIKKEMWVQFYSNFNRGWVPFGQVCENGANAYLNTYLRIHGKV